MVRPRVISPDGDRRSDKLTSHYRLSEHGRGVLFVNGKRRGADAVSAYGGDDRLEREGAWTTRAAGRLRDPAARLRPGGEQVGPDAGDPVAVRYVALGRDRITAAAGAPFAVRVSSDAVRVRWTLGGRSGFARPGTLRLRAPLQKGRFTLTVSANGHTARAAVFVREPLR